MRKRRRCLRKCREGLVERDLIVRVAEHFAVRQQRASQKEHPTRKKRRGRAGCALALEKREICGWKAAGDEICQVALGIGAGEEEAEDRAVWVVVFVWLALLD